MAGSPARGGLHRGGRDHLHQVVDDHVAQRADRVVEVTAILDPEVLGHRDLDALEVVAAPQGLQDRVREPEVQDLLQAHLPEVVVDPEELRLVDVLVELVGELPGGLLVVPERLLDHDRGLRGQAGLGQPLDDASEQERRDLEVEHRCLRTRDRGAHPLVGRGIGEVAADVRQPFGEAVEDDLVELLAGLLDRGPGPFDELVEGPVVRRHPDHGAGQEPALLQAVEGAEGHHPRQVARDAEHHEHVRGSRLAAGGCRCHATQRAGRPRHLPRPRGMIPPSPGCGRHGPGRSPGSTGRHGLW